MTAAGHPWLSVADGIATSAQLLLVADRLRGAACRAAFGAAGGYVTLPADHAPSPGSDRLRLPLRPNQPVAGQAGRGNLAVAVTGQEGERRVLDGGEDQDDETCPCATAARS